MEFHSIHNIVHRGLKSSHLLASDGDTARPAVISHSAPQRRTRGIEGGREGGRERGRAWGAPWPWARGSCGPPPESCAAASSPPAARPRPAVTHSSNHSRIRQRSRRRMLHWRERETGREGGRVREAFHAAGAPTRGAMLGGAPDKIHLAFLSRMGFVPLQDDSEPRPLSIGTKPLPVTTTPARGSLCSWRRTYSYQRTPTLPRAQRA